MSFNSELRKTAHSTTVSVSGSASAGTTYQGPIMHLASEDVAPGSLCANVTTAITTSSLQILTKWQVSQDGTTWVDFYGTNCGANTRVSAAGTGSAVSGFYVQSLPHDIAYPHVCLAVTASAASGGSADLAIISYNYRKRNAVG